MRNAVREYLCYSDEEKRDLWDHATFVFDTNIYLNLYRYTAKTRELLFSALSGLKERLWMPNHVAREYMKNRNNIIWETNHQYSTLQSEAEKYIELCRATLKIEQNDEDLDGLKNQILTWINKAKESNVIVASSNSDSILNQLLTIYDGKVGPAFSNEEQKVIEAEGKTRYSAEVPPGYKDATKQRDENQNNKYGDLFVWKQILNYALSEKKDIIFVTNDQKEDWWEILHGQTIGPRVELRKEFTEITSQRFYMYTVRNFITQLGNAKDVKIDRDTIDEIESYFNANPGAINEKAIRDFYYDREGKLEQNRVLLTRREIAKLENKNQKRIKTINQITKKYNIKDMPEDVETALEHTIANYERDRKIIDKLQAELIRIRE